MARHRQHRGHAAPWVVARSVCREHKPVRAHPAWVHVLDFNVRDSQTWSCPVGIRVLGFKPLECLRDYHNLRAPTFVYPTDKQAQGSTTAFIALHGAMLEERRFAVASAVLGKAAAPQLVALLPQQEERNEFDEQVR